MEKKQYLNSSWYIIFITLVVCVIAALIVTWAAISLRSRQESNEKNAFSKQVLTVANISYTSKTVNTLYKNRLIPFVLNMNTYTIEPNKNADNFNIDNVLSNQKQSQKFSPNTNIIGMLRRPNIQRLYAVLDENGQISSILYPIYGKGLWSTLWGYININLQGDKVLGIIFYKQGETPGLGARITTKKWRDLWIGKRMYNDQGKEKLSVVKNASSIFQVDALTGATLTSNGVNNLVHYWLGENGFQPFIQKLQKNQQQIISTLESIHENK